MINIITVRELAHPERVFSYNIVMVNGDYNHPIVTIERPPSSALPDTPIEVELTWCGKHFGILTLSKDGFEPIPGRLHESPYFKVMLGEEVSHE